MPQFSGPGQRGSIRVQDWRRTKSCSRASLSGDRPVFSSAANAGPAALQALGSGQMVKTHACAAALEHNAISFGFETYPCVFQRTEAYVLRECLLAHLSHKLRYFGHSKPRKHAVQTMYITPALAAHPHLTNFNQLSLCGRRHFRSFLQSVIAIRR
jgi:hypothetical protein